MWAGPQQSETHRGLHRRGVAAGGGRAAHCYQGHGARPEAPGPALGTKPSHSHTDSPCPAGPGRRERSHQGLAPPRGRPLKGQTPLQPSRWSQHQVAAARPSFLLSPVLPTSPPRPPKHVGGGAGAGPQVQARSPAGKEPLVRWYSSFLSAAGRWGSVLPPQKHTWPCPPCPAQSGHLSSALGLNCSVTQQRQALGRQVLEDTGLG